MKTPKAPTDAQMAQLRHAITAILDLPVDGMGCVLLVPFAVRAGEETGLRMMTMGITPDFATVILLKAANITANDEPVRQGIFDPGVRD